MQCPHNIAAHQIQGLDYPRCLPVLEWLIKILMESRDTRASLTKKQGVYNYNLSFKQDKAKRSKVDLSKMKDIIFVGKPRREYKANKNIQDVKLQDPKRIHQALREFNDMSANKVFA